MVMLNLIMPDHFPVESLLPQAPSLWKAINQSPSLKTFLNTTFAIINSPSPDPLKGLVHLNVFVFHKVTSREQEWRWS